MLNYNKSLVCKLAAPAIGCDYFEMYILAFLFFLVSLSCLYLIIHYFRSKMWSKTKGINFHVIYWGFMMIWSLFRSCLHLYPFPYTYKTFNLWYINVNNIIFYLTLSIVIFIICEHYFQYRNPGPGADCFFRVFLLIFLGVFLYLGVLLSYTSGVPSGVDSSLMYLWHGCVSLLFGIFVLVPSLSLISAISYPVVQPEDASCVSKSKLIVWTSFSILFVRSMYNILNFLGYNPILKWYFEDMNAPTDTLSRSRRIFGFSFSFIFTFLPTLMSMLGVYVVFKHDIDFLDDSFYAAAKSDTESYVA